MVELFITIITMIIVLSLAAVGGSLSERSGVINLSIEGFMIIGALCYAVLVGRPGKGMNEFGSTVQFSYMLLAALITMISASVYGILVIFLKANQTIAGIALNALALSAAIFVIYSSMNPNHSGSNEKIDIQKGLWNAAGPGQISNPLSIINTAVVLGIPLIIITIIFLNKTKLGIKIKTCGEQPQAAASLGMNVRLIQLLAIVLASGTSAIAGAIYIQQGSQFNGSTSGMGFLAVAIVIFGQWRPTYIILGAVLFGGLTGIILKPALVPGLKNIDSSYKDILAIVPYLVSLTVLVLTQKHNQRYQRYQKRYSTNEKHSYYA